MKYSTTKFDAAIVGAGIVGAACAELLSREGLRVAIIEAGEPAGGVTAAGMGHIVVMDDSEAQLALTAYSRRLWDDAAPGLGDDVEYDRCGTIWVAESEEDLEEARSKHRKLAEAGIESEVLDSRQLREAEPEVREGLSGGLLVPGDSVVYQLCATRKLIASAISSGAESFSGVSVETISDGGLSMSDGSEVRSEFVVIAAGCASAKLIGNLEILPRKGHLVITARSRRSIRHQLVELGYLRSAHSTARDSVAFNIQPRPTGQLIIGSSRQFGAESPEVDPGMIRLMLRRAIGFLPGLRSRQAIRAWTGFRPATPDNLPYIGSCPGFERVLAATGHEGLGITTALATARLIADEIAGRDSEIDRAPYSPQRHRRPGQSI